MSFHKRLARRQSGETLKVAIVLVGQPRTWRECLPWWTDLFAQQGDVVYDVFAHIWNFDTIGHGAASEKRPIDPKDLKDLVGLLKPKKLLIEGTDANPTALLAKLRKPHQVEASSCEWQASQFYSMMRAAHLKRSYEIDHMMEYDVCVKGRMDMVLGEPQHLPISPLPEGQTIYTTHSYWDESFARRRIGDMCYYGDSPTFDRAADFFRHLNDYPISAYTHEGRMMPPEMPFRDYLLDRCQLVESILPWGPGPRLKRPPSYQEILKKEGRSLGEHEIF